VFKRILAMLPTGLLLTVGCSTKSEPAESGSAPHANLPKVTIYVESMIQRQGIT
jgi:hypothetical protein